MMKSPLSASLSLSRKLYSIITLGSYTARYQRREAL